MNRRNNENKQTIKHYKKYLKKYIKWNLFNLAIFIFDFLLFISIIIFFTITIFVKDLLEINKFIFKYFILISSFYTLLKFSINNFFYDNSYFKKIQIYNKEIKIRKTKLKISKDIPFVSLNFLVIFNLMNIIIALILNYQTGTLFSKQEFVKALVLTLTNLLLIPSFVSSLNKIFTVRKSTNNNYKRLIRDQFLANINLFKKYQPINNYEYIQFEDLELKSSKGIFFLTSFQDSYTINKLIKDNNDILSLYQDIWNNYCQYLIFINSTNLNNFTKYKNFYITRIFDQIFIDFFNI